VGDTALRLELTRLGIDTFSPATRFHAEESVLEAIRHRLEWAERQKLIRSFTCEPSTDPPVHVVVIDWWDPIDQPVHFTRAHDHRGTGSAWGDQ
jgi:hypothetical protein